MFGIVCSFRLLFLSNGSNLSYFCLPPSFPRASPGRFQSINFAFKLVLWATLVFFRYGSQLQIGTALLLCVGRLALHAQFEPYRASTNNVFDYVTLIITALFGLGAIMLQSLETSKNLSILKGDLKGSEAIRDSIKIVDMVLQIMVIAVLVVYVVFSLHSLFLRRSAIFSMIRGKFIDWEEIILQLRQLRENVRVFINEVIIRLYYQDANQVTFLSQGFFQSVRRCVGKRCPCLLRCAKRCCPTCCFKRRKRVRTKAALPASFSSDPRVTQSAVNVEMTSHETRGSDGNAEGGLAHTNPLYPQLQRVASSRGIASMPSTTQAAQDGVAAEEASQNLGAGERRARSDTLNPIFPGSLQMVELHGRSNSQMVLKRKMDRPRSVGI